MSAGTMTREEYEALIRRRVAAFDRALCVMLRSIAEELPDDTGAHATMFEVASRIRQKFAVAYPFAADLLGQPQERPAARQ